MTKFDNLGAMVVGDTTTHPVPRVGERVKVFYDPPPAVVSVLYDFRQGEIWVLLE